ncbi:MAG: prepilin-type N-terminal cleavage/methylation domain-containing protein [bacterium]
MMIKRAFTLIELLIVVAIIAILAAIAVPNFLEAQTRAKVSRARADMRSMATALEVYFSDNNGYLPSSLEANLGKIFMLYGVNLYLIDHTVPIFDLLTTPIAYMTNARIEDPFRYRNWGTSFNNVGVLGYNYGSMKVGLYWKPLYKWIIQSNGPNCLLNEDWGGTDWIQYDPTNGTISGGNIARYGP